MVIAVVCQGRGGGKNSICPKLKMLCSDDAKLYLRELGAMLQAVGATEVDEKFVEVPQIQTIDKVVEVPRIQIQEIVRHAPRVRRVHFREVSSYTAY